MNKYNEFVKKRREEAEEDEAIVQEIIQILKNYSLSVNRINSILELTKAEVTSQARLS